MRRFWYTLATISFLANSAYSFLDNSHKQIAEEGVRLLREVARSEEYEELYDVSQYQDIMLEGAAEQDYGSVQGNQRSFRHFFDPDQPAGRQGLKYEDFYPVWQAKDILEKTAKNSFGLYWEKNKWVDVTEPPGGYYESAVEWAWDSGGNKDLNNWLSAIHTYGYTETSRKEAYRRLGHVMHLLGDCAEPDHVYNIPHPGSDRVNDVSDAVLTGDVVALAGTYYGYERFVEETEFLLNPRRVERRNNFRSYFVGLARHSKSELRKSGLDVPLGLRKKLTNIGPVGVVEIYWTPTINSEDREQRGKYIALSRATMDHAAELCAGMMLDFHEIVNQPPFLKEIRIVQDGEIVYHARWKGTFHTFPQDPHTYNRGFNRLLDRKLEKIIEGKTLLADKEAEIYLLFGPTAPPGEWMDPSITVNIGENKIEYFDRIDDHTFRKTFTLSLPEKKRKQQDLVIEVHAKDLHTHYVREGYGVHGYELDSNPETPAEVAGNDAPYDWRGYEAGPDTNHKITVERESMPPIVQSVQLTGDNNLYLDETWMDIEDSNERKLSENEDVHRGGINIARIKEATLTITFDQEIDEESLRVHFGRLEAAMSRVGETNAYQGKIDLTKLYKLRLDDIVQISIEAKNSNGMTLDSIAKTKVHLDETMDEWSGYEPGADAYFNVRVFHRLKGKHIVKGRVRSHAPETLDEDWHVQNVFTFGNAMTQGPLEYWHPAGKPVSGGNLYYGVTYAEITDAKLFEKFIRCARTFEAIRAKTQRGIYRISQAEYRDYLRLMKIKKQVKKATVYKSGSKPGWKVPVGENGWCEIPLPVFPGEKNVIYMQLYTRYVPELGKPSKFTIDRQGTHSRNLYYHPGYYGSGFVGEDELDPAFVKTAPDFYKPYELELRRIALQREIGKIKTKIEKIKNNFPRPKDLEETWKARARKQQKEYEIEFKKEHGKAEKWTEDLRDEYMNRMYEIPFEAKKSWKTDLTKWKEKRKKAFKDSVTALKNKQKELAQTKIDLQKTKDEVAEWREKLREQAGEFCWAISKDWEHFAPHVYELGGTFSGNEITPETRPGYRTAVNLWKVTIDETKREKQIWGTFSGDGQNMVIANLEYDDGPKPPFLFKLNQQAEPEYLIINDFIDAEWDMNTRDRTRVGAGPVQAISGGIYKWDGVLRCVDTIYLYFSLPHKIEVEGYPIRNRAEFDKLCDETFEAWTEILMEQAKADDALAMKLKNGEIDKNQLQKLKMEIVTKYSTKAQEFMKKRAEIMKMNPAFDEQVKQRILRGN